VTAQLGILLIVLILLVVSVSRWKIHPFIALVLAALSLGLLLGMGGAETADILLDGFGNTLKWIAVVVILGAFIGEVLRDTGGASRIANAVVGKTGPKRLPWAMGFTGYLVSIPVFVDVAYIVLQPVTEALAGRSGKPVLMIGLALVAGLIVSHTLIPPTPGPMAVISMLDADIGRLLLINAFVGVCAMVGGIIWASRYCSVRLPQDDRLAEQVEEAESEASSINFGVFWDLTPILVPIFLMGIGSFYGAANKGAVGQILDFLGTPMIAVLIGAGIAALQFKRLHRRQGLGQLVENAITKSALVIMITGAGGAFGYIIRESGMPDSLTAMFEQLPYLGLMLPFLVASVLTTATGSITVSLIGTASIVGPMSGSLGYSPEIMAALIGAGALCVNHANASLFWLLNRLHDVPVGVLYRTYTLQTLVMGLSALAGILLLRAVGVE
jgi:GntP family gluconate:H+ symporter